LHGDLVGRLAFDLGRKRLGQRADGRAKRLQIAVQSGQPEIELGGGVETREDGAQGLDEVPHLARQCVGVEAERSDGLSPRLLPFGKGAERGALGVTGCGQLRLGLPLSIRQTPPLAVAVVQQA